MKFLTQIDNASKVKIVDVAENFVATDVEGALAELAASPGGALVLSVNEIDPVSPTTGDIWIGVI